MMLMLRLAFRMIEQRQFGRDRREVSAPGLVSPTCRYALLAFLFISSSASFAEVQETGIDPTNLGKGDWIYSISDATNRLGGHVNTVSNETSLMLFYKTQGIRFIVVKAATSDQLFKGCYSGPQFTRALVDTAHTNGLTIFGYNRSFGSNIVGEISIADYVFSQGADGFVWDAEAEWESNNSWIGSTGPSKAWRLCSTVRSNWPAKFLAHAPFPIISYHPTFPYKEFGYWCDAVMPQIYHSGWTGVLASASGGINWADANWAAWQKSLASSNSVINGTTIYWTNAIKPLAPVAEVYGLSWESHCAGVTAPLRQKDILEFLDYLSADPNCPCVKGYKGVSFWRSDLHSSVQWAHIKNSTVGVTAGIVNNVVMDDADASLVGSWKVVPTYSNGLLTGPNYRVDANTFGTNYLMSPRGDGKAAVEFKPLISVAGDYDIYEWHPTRPNASARVPFVITNGDLTNVFYANQQTNGGNWSWLGRLKFPSGTNSAIRITDAIPETNAVAIADGIKLVLVPKSSGTPPSGGSVQ